MRRLTGVERRRRALIATGLLVVVVVTGPTALARPLAWCGNQAHAVLDGAR